MAHFPALSETIAAASGEGCAWNERPARVSEGASLREGIVAHANAASFARPGREMPDRLQRTAGFCAGWADAYAYHLVATGRVEVAIDPVMHASDCAPFLPILQEAGGYGDWCGDPTIYGGEAMATTRRLLAEVLQLLNRATTGDAG